MAKKNGSTNLYALVAFNLPVKDFFTYEIPPAFSKIAKEGMRVIAPFGRKRLTGYVVGLTRHVDKSLSLKSIEEFPDSEPAVSGELLKLTRWMADYYRSSWGEAIKAAIPAGLENVGEETFELTETGAQILVHEIGSKSILSLLRWIKKNPQATGHKIRREFGNNVSKNLVKAKKNTWIKTGLKLKTATAAYTTEKKYKALSLGLSQKVMQRLLARSPKQKRIYGLLKEDDKSGAELSKIEPYPYAALRQLCIKGLIEIVEIRTERCAETARENHSRKEDFQFTPEQKIVYRKLSGSLHEKKFSVNLLHGVTGSGKTEIYIRCVEKSIELGKQAIIMAPEISLTPQMAYLFQKRFGDRVAVLHSGLSNIERYLEWKKIQQNRVSVAIGARSVVL